MAKFKMRELPEGMHLTGGRLVPHLEKAGEIDLNDIAHDIAGASAFTPGDVMGVVELVMDRVAKHIAQGYTVKLGNFGSFRAKLALAKFAEPEQKDEGSRRTGRSVRVSGVRFRAGKELVRRSNSFGNFERIMPKDGGKDGEKPDKTARRALLESWFREHSLLTVRQYARLTGLSNSGAAKELRAIRQEEGSHLATEGAGTHMVYVWKAEQ